VNERRRRAIETAAPIIEEMESRYPERDIARVVVDAVAPILCPAQQGHPAPLDLDSLGPSPFIRVAG
jgi:hypothetical protein